MKYRLIKALLLKTLLVISLGGIMSSAFAESTNKSAVENLSPNLRDLLKKEMVAIDIAMKELVSLNAAGDTENISRIAKQIKQSFILKQSLTEKQRHELHQTLPADFVEQDQAFHYYAGMLAHVSEKKKTELIGFYYNKLFEACASCHQAYAKHKFPHFEDGIKDVKHKH